MKLPIPFIKKKNKEENEYFLALLLTDERAEAVILKEHESKLKVLNQNSEEFTTPLDEITHEEFVKILDKTISKAEEVLPPDIETQKTVFGVKEDWVDKETKKIKKENLAKLKRASDKLDMKPIGFMVVSEAIAHFLGEEEGAPLSAVMIEAGEKSINVSLFRAGKIIETKKGELTGDSFAETTDKLLRHFTAPTLPARIVLFPTKKSEKLAQELTNHEWNKNIPFLHIPQITSLPEGFDGKAVTFGAGEQMGFEILGISKTDITETNKDADNSPDIKNDKPSTPDNGDNFGFVENIDAAKLKKEETISLIPEEDSPEVDLGQNNSHDETSEDEKQEQQAVKKKAILTAFLSITQKLRELSKKLSLSKFSGLPSLLKKSSKTKLMGIVAGVIILLGIGSWLFYQNVVTAEIALSIKPEIIKEEENVIFSVSGGNDFSQNIIAAKSISTTVSGDVSTKATGKKDVGDKAKGTVTIFNNSKSKVTINSGTTIESSNDLVFTLDDNITVASASGDIFSGTKPGTTDVKVTARDIGQESNLPSGTKFSIGGNSELAARNDDAFSGGSKKTVTVVDADDLSRLETDLVKKLEKQASEELSKKANTGETLIPTILSAKITKPSFDKDEGDESSTIKLTGSVVFEEMVYRNQDLEDFTKTLLKSGGSENIEIANDTLKVKTENLKKRDDQEVSAKLIAEAGVLPEIKSDDITSSLKGKSKKEATSMLSNLPQVSDSKIRYSPGIFIPSYFFPSLPNKINIVVEAE